MTGAATSDDAPLRARVLIVDDDERNLLAAVETLNELGHDLVTAKSGPEALRKLLEEEEFAVILLDLHMPGMDGYETAEMIRSRKRTRDVPIVFVTAVFRDEAHIFQAYSAGAVDVVFKPVDPFILRAKVQVLTDLHLKRREVQREAEHSRRLLQENAQVRSAKEEAERALAHSQKMEAVGQLTGGVAHDFNNLLTVVLGNVELMAKATGGDPKAERRLGAIRHAAERGRSLTRQLLAFSRRQHLTPMTLCVKKLVNEFAPLMRQALGEAVTLTMELPQEALCVHVDPAQMESALLNLAVNARDAMPDGGRLVVAVKTLKTSDGLDRAHPEAPDGDWAVVEVRDTGKGLLPEVAERIFEPFFTTKEVGKGTGLGLSQVYGFVRQSGGYVTVDSLPGEGACFRLHLQIAQGGASDARPSGPAFVEAPRGQGERILLVEDDAPVLALGVEMLTDLGYEVSSAPSGQEALDRVREGAKFDILFSDVVMPGGMTGVQLAHAVRDLRPEARILLTSGYVGELEPLAEQGFDLIDKPYERAALATRLRELLGERAQAA
ncbi:MAG: response regulator [Proteobacteria bacterium]|nr:response regulator [Pseudomonadota bacterium]